MEKDKRKRERSSLDQMIELSTSDGKKIRAKGVNISESGMLCLADEDIHAGTFVMFKIAIQSGGSSMKVDLEGMVMKSTRDGDKYNIVIDLTS